MVYSCLDFEPRHIEEIALRTGLSVSQSMDALLELELGGYAVRTAGLYYTKKIILKDCHGFRMHICLIGHSRESFREDLMIGDMAHKYRNRNKEFTMANHLVIVESPAKVKTIKKTFWEAIMK